MKKIGVKLFVSLVTVSMFAFAALGSDDDYVPTFKDIISLKTPRQAKISPDGCYVVYLVRETNWEKDGYDTRIWLREIETGNTRQIIQDRLAYSLDWTPDSKMISFVSKGDNGNQIYTIPAAGDELRQVTNFDNIRFGNYSWSPDGKWIAYTTTEVRPQGGSKAGDEELGKFEIFEQKYNFITRLWLFDPETKECRPLVDDEDLFVGFYDWNPDGSSIVFEANPSWLPHSFTESDIYTVDVANRKIRPLVQRPGPDTIPFWSPCGKWVGFFTTIGEYRMFTNTELAIVPADGGEPLTLTRGFDESVFLGDWNDKGLFFGAYKGMSKHYFRIDPEDWSITQFTQGEGAVFEGGSFTSDGSRMAYISLDPDDYQEIYWTGLGRFDPIKITDFSDQIDGWRLGKKEMISWRNSDGVEISGVLVKPFDFNPTKKYPLFVVIHGGPIAISTPQAVDSFNKMYPVEQWVNKGAIVLEPNYRGSAGFGEEFRSLAYRNFGVGDYEDVISGVDFLVSQGFVDKDKVGVMGWSQGGYVAAFISTYSDRFATVSVGAGISDWVSYYCETDMTPFIKQYLGATPWQDPEIYKVTSPISYINKACTPTLIQHGEYDSRVPMSNARKLYRGLKDHGVPVELIIYAGEGHVVSKPKGCLAVLQHNWDWFAKYIWGEGSGIE